MSDAMEVLEPSGSSVAYNGERLTIKPLSIGHIPKLLRAARTVLDTVLDLDDLPEENSDDMVKLVLDLIEKHDDQVFEAAAICTGKKAAWLQDGGVDEFIVLVKTIFEVNRDFFVQKVAPLLGDQVASMLASLGVGRTPSSSSSSTDIASTTSAGTASDSSTPSAKPAPACATGS